MIQKLKDCCLVFDFDSTFVKLEALDELANIALKDNPNREAVCKEINQITNLGMEGKISFAESLSSRLSLFTISQNHIQKVVTLLKQNISDSIVKHQDFFKNNADNIYIISGGFTECIAPVLTSFGLLENHIFANSFVINNQEVTGVDEKNLLLQPQGKVKVIKNIGLTNKIYVVGDGYTDYQIKEEGVADKFFAFCENVSRPSVNAKADFVVNSFDEILEEL